MTSPPNTKATETPDRLNGKPGIVVIGAGPAGLTAAFQLRKHGLRSTVLEADDQVGGISRTVERDGWRFDIGGHRFFTKVGAVEELWHEILPADDFLLRPRRSRIFYESKYFAYPLKPGNALRSLGPIEAARCIGSYLSARMRPPVDQTNYESWLVARFGWRLYRTFFKTYTEKVWGVPVSEMPADWAAQRIKSLSLGKAIAGALRPRRHQKKVTSLIDEFQYPKYGPGMMWEACRDKVVAQGSEVLMQTEVVQLRHSDGRVTRVLAQGRDGARSDYESAEVISSMPISRLIQAMDPPVPSDVRRAADDLRYRDFLTVALVAPADKVAWTDNWIYVHDPEVRAMRIQNFGSWSPYLVKEGRNVLGLEYTLFEGDAAWRAPDQELIERGKRELEQLRLVRPQDIETGYVIRQRRAYPIYDERYRANVEKIRSWLSEHATNVHPVGRNGMFRYNNQDHSMYTAMLTVENIATGACHDIWEVNVEAEYHEQPAVSTVPDRPRGTGRDAPLIRRAVIDRAIAPVPADR